MAIIFVYAADTNQSLTSVLNSLGIFLSSVGVVVAILTVVQQHYLHQSKEISIAVNSSNNFMFKLGCILEVYCCIKRNYLEQYCDNEEGAYITLLDGEIAHWLIEIDWDKSIFISEFDSQAYVDSYHAIFNYNRYVEDIFRWQKNQKMHSDKQNTYHLTQRLNALDEYGSRLIELQNKMSLALKKNYPEHTFFSSSVPLNSFKNLNTSL